MGHVQMASRIALVLSPLALVTLTAIFGLNFQTSAIAQSSQAPLFQPAVAYDAGGYITNAVVAAISTAMEGSTSFRRIYSHAPIRSAARAT